jgi:hypothetical protein
MGIAIYSRIERNVLMQNIKSTISRKKKMASGNCAVPLISVDKCKTKSKAIPITGLKGLWGSEMLWFPHCPDKLFTDGGKVVSPMHQPRSTSQKHNYFSVSGTHLLEAV